MIEEIITYTAASAATVCIVGFAAIVVRVAWGMWSDR